MLNEAKDDKIKRPVCPRCGCAARYIKMTAKVTCVLLEDGDIGPTTHVGRRVGEAEYMCDLNAFM